MALSKNELKRLKQLQKMKEEMGDDFPAERQGELEGLLKQKEDSENE